MYIFNWFFCCLTTILFALILRKQRYLFVKPSIIFLLFFHIRIQWSGTLNFDLAEAFLQEPGLYAGLLNVFPLVSLLTVACTGRERAKNVWKRLVQSRFEVSNTFLTVLLGGTVLVTAYYLFYLPFSQSGLWAIFADPLHSQQRREESLKLVDANVVRYLYSFMRAAFAPLLAVIVGQMLVDAIRERRFFDCIWALAILLFVLFAVSIPGSRAPALYVLMVLFMSRWLRSGLRIRPIRLAVAIVTLLSIPALFTMLREQQEITLSAYAEYLMWMWARAFESPAEVAMWYMHYAEDVGLIGLGGIPKLAWFANVEPVPLDNIIGLTYATTSIESISAGTCFLFSYYAYFGALSIPFSFAFVLFLDSAILICRRLSNRILLPFVTSIMLAAATLTESDYSVLFITNGYLILMALVLVLDKAVLIGKAVGLDHSASSKSLCYTGGATTRAGS